MKKRLALYGVLLLVVAFVMADVFMAGDGHVTVVKENVSLVEENQTLTDQNQTLSSENQKLNSVNQQLTEQVSTLTEQVETYEEQLNTPPPTPTRPKSDWNLEVPTNE